MFVCGIHPVGVHVLRRVPGLSFGSNKWYQSDYNLEPAAMLNDSDDNNKDGDIDSSASLLGGDKLKAVVVERVVKELGAFVVYPELTRALKVQRVGACDASESRGARSL
ncbi:hypothetical protein U9M48_023339 [Paspalum notatum var. saurae]|uniref:Uncharacterized protein n=1 Tax=Paspalum notatum var. saurae TaxID=547442 RepID=A0AAQ3WV15_PASNO